MRMESEQRSPEAIHGTPDNTSSLAGHSQVCTVTAYNLYSMYFYKLNTDKPQLHSPQSHCTQSWLDIAFALWSTWREIRTTTVHLLCGESKDLTGIDSPATTVLAQHNVAVTQADMRAGLSAVMYRSVKQLDCLTCETEVVLMTRKSK